MPISILTCCRRTRDMFKSSRCIFYVTKLTSHGENLTPISAIRHNNFRKFIFANKFDNMSGVLKVISSDSYIIFINENELNLGCCRKTNPFFLFWQIGNIFYK